MLAYKSIDGQTIYDVCLMTYGSLDYLSKLINDNLTSQVEAPHMIPDINANVTLHPRWNDSGDPTIFGTDRFGFGALPSGQRFSDGAFLSIGDYDNLWSSFDGDYYALYSYLYYDYGTVNINGQVKMIGFSIRAVRTATTDEQLLPDGLIDAIYTDIDGNVYTCTKIGLQVWTTSNLKVTHYADGPVIPTNLSDANWNANTTGAMAVYGKNEGAYVPTDELTTEALMVAAYGRLYNWYAVNNSHGLIDTTTGFHVQSDAEFTQLTDYLIATYSDITIDNVGDVLKSKRQVNSPILIQNGTILETITMPIDSPVVSGQIFNWDDALAVNLNTNHYLLNNKLALATSI